MVIHETPHEGPAVAQNGTCLRCHEPFGDRDDGKCAYCRVHKDRRVIPPHRMKRRSKIGGKRGRNSGTTNKSKA